MGFLDKTKDLDYLMRETWDILGGQPGGSIRLCNVRTFLLAILGIHIELDNPD